MSLQDYLMYSQITGGGNATVVSVSGTPSVGQTLTMVLGKGWTAASQQWVRIDSNGTSTDISGATGTTYTLVSGDKGYRISVRATGLTNVGTGMMIPFQVPSAPTITAASGGNGTGSFTFSAPADNGGQAVSEYRLYVYKSSDDTTVGAYVSGSASPLVKTGLTNGISYYGKVSAVNSVGEGILSAASVAILPSLKINALSSATLIGDSRMAYGNPVLSGSNPTQGGGTSVSHVDWMNDVERLGGGVGIDAIFLRAVGGVPLSTILSSQVPSALTDATDIVWCHGGVNSFNNSIGGSDTLANNIAVAKQIIDQLRAVKKVVIFDSIDPVDQNGITGAKGRWAEFPQFNSAIQAYCNQFSNVIFNDTFSAMVDSSSQTNNPLPNLIRTDDGIHNTTAGGQVQGYASRTNVMSRLNLTKFKTVGTNTVSALGTTGGTTTPGTGTVSGSVPANWNVQVVSGSAAVVVSQSSAGTTRLTVTNGSSAASTIYLQATNTSALLALATTGSMLQAGVDFAVQAQSGLTRIAVSKRFNGSGGTLWNVMARDTTTAEPDAVFKWPANVFSGRRVTKPYTMGSNATSAEFIIAINVAINGSCTIDFSNPTFNNLT